MKLTTQIANQFEELHLNGNWVARNLKTQLSDVTWEEATTQVGSLNTIAILAFHINYYVAGVSQVLEGGSLDIRDKYSFDMPAINSEHDWQQMLSKLWRDAQKFADLVANMPDDKLSDYFVDEKYGNYYRNLQVIIEHSYYHMGQIALIKKLVKTNKQSIDITTT